MGNRGAGRTGGSRGGGRTRASDQAGGSNNTLIAIRAEKLANLVMPDLPANYTEDELIQILNERTRNAALVEETVKLIKERTPTIEHVHGETEEEEE